MNKHRWYSASYHKFYNSIFALGDICDLIPEEDADVCILEEPEHLNWYRAPGKWNFVFQFSMSLLISGHTIAKHLIFGIPIQTRLPFME